MSFLFPVLLNLEGRRCLVIGEAVSAAPKADGLREAGADVAVCDPAAYQEGDMNGAFLVISTHRDPEFNRRLFREAETRGILFHAMDDPDHCRFIYPAVYRQGDLIVSVSTGGKSPALACRLRDQFGREIGPEHTRFLEVLGALRGDVAARFPDFETRRRLWLRAIDSSALSHLRDGNEEKARAVLAEILENPDS